MQWLKYVQLLNIMHVRGGYELTIMLKCKVHNIIIIMTHKLQMNP